MKALIFTTLANFFGNLIKIINDTYRLKNDKYHKL